MRVMRGRGDVATAQCKSRLWSCLYVLAFQDQHTLPKWNILVQKLNDLTLCCSHCNKFATEWNPVVLCMEVQWEVDLDLQEEEVEWVWKVLIHFILIHISTQAHAAKMKYCASPNEILDLFIFLTGRGRAILGRGVMIHYTITQMECVWGPFDLYFNTNTHCQSKILCFFFNYRERGYTHSLCT